MKINIWSVLLPIGRLAVDLVIPQICLLCGVPLLPCSQRRPPICDHCQQRLIEIGGERCRYCGIPLISEIDCCLRCRECRHHFVSHRAIYRYSDDIRSLMHWYKFRAQRGVAHLFGRQLYRCWARQFGDLPVVPVPSSPAAIAKRGWSPTEELVRAMRQWGPVPIIRLLRRRRTVAQKSLGRSQRYKNIHGAILVSRRITPPPRLVLVDDVFTSGATLDECARVLNQRGVRQVYGLTVAID